jgi:hypothetical protein
MSNQLKSRSAFSRSFGGGPGYREYFHEDPITGQWRIEEVQDVTDTVEWNKSRYASTDERAGFPDHNTHIAQIPYAIYYNPKYKHLWEDQGELKKFINDPDNRHFLTRPIKL